MGQKVYVYGEIKLLRCIDMGRKVYVYGGLGVQIWGMQLASISI